MSHPCHNIVPPIAAGLKIVLIGPDCNPDGCTAFPIKGRDIVKQSGFIRVIFLNPLLRNLLDFINDPFLEIEVIDLKNGLEAVEERARSELGMIGEDDTFYLIIE